ncbi:MAG: hypothetical protein JXA93_06635 [Anaerolineae bacterium]|nr:hypothetical protein [Anaerolineae bacterium]
MEQENSAAIARLGHLCKLVGYGRLIVEVVAGEPRCVEAQAQIRLDKPMWPGVEELIRQAPPIK